jgi:glutamine amidotransferase
MCRLLGYLGSSVKLEHLIQSADHSLVEQSYQPQEMTAGLLNADGFGIACFDIDRAVPPFVYRSILPIWNDTNLPSICRFIRSDCVIASVRSATPGLAVDLSNCQPYNYDGWIFAHNGYIDNFRRSLYRPMADLLIDELYQNVHGTTDSEHIFALLLKNLRQFPDRPLLALAQTVNQVLQLAEKWGVFASLNLLFSNGQTLYAGRCSSRSPAPSLYYLQTGQGVYLASEPMQFRYLEEAQSWQAFPESSFAEIGRNRDGSFSFYLHSL